MQLNRLRILRTPGLTVPFTLEPEPGLNLVTGPNGVGKSSVCRAVLSLLWPDLIGEEPFEAEAEISLGGDQVRVSRRDRESPLWSGGTRPNLGPDHLAGRHQLGVLDLLAPGPDGDPLAREIRQQMAGGFDLGQLRQDLFARRTGRSENTELKKALEQVARIKKEQKGLAFEQNRLDELAAEKNLAQAAGQRLTALETLRDLIRETEARDEAARQLAGLPEACAAVRAEDPDNLKKLKTRKLDLVREIAGREAALEKIRAEKQTLISGGGLDAELEPGLLKKKVSDLEELRRDLRSAEREADGSDLTGIVSGAAVEPPKWPAVLLTVAGFLLIVAGGLLPVPGPYLPLVLMLLGGMALMAGILGLRSFSRGARRSRLAFEEEARLAKARDRAARCGGQLNDALLDFNAVLATGGLDPVDDVDEAAQTLDDLTKRRDRLTALAAQLDNHEEILAKDRMEADRVTGESATVRKRLNLADDSDAAEEAARLLELAPRFTQAAGARDDAIRQIERLENKMAGYASCLGGDETPTISEAVLAERIETEVSRAEGYDELVREIADIETRIKHASGGHQLQDALAAAESARAALTEARQANREATLGQLLLDRVQQRHEKESRPVVLEKAAALFHLFTGRTHHLEMASSGNGEDRFLARAEHSARPLELAELSDGTRAQLLLAVKLAFLTAGEEGVQAPIFLDDSLTSADPARFAAVVGSLARLAAEEKRQIFYLTPNPADAAAILRVLEKEGLAPAHHLDLARIRALAGTADPALLDPANLPQIPMAPDPAGLSAAEYGAALLVPRPDPWAPREGLHVFHVLNENLDLVRRLVDGSAATVGRFSSARDSLVAGKIITPTEADLTAAGAAVWNAWLDGWRLGRTRPVDRAFLNDSNAVSDKFVPLVMEVLEKCGGDGAELLAAIENKQVKGFRSNKLEELREELGEAGLLAHGTPLDDDDLISHTRDRVKNLLAAGILDMKKVRTLALTFARLVSAAATENAG